MTSSTVVFLQLVVTALCLASTSQQQPNRTLQILIVHSSGAPTQNLETWLNDTEAFSIAKNVTEDINLCLLEGYMLEAVDMSSQSPQAVVDFVKALTNAELENATIIGMVGSVGHLFARTILPLLAIKNIPTIIEPFGLRLHKGRSYPHLFTSKHSLEQEMDTVLKLIQTRNCTRVGVIYSVEDHLHEQTAKSFLHLSHYIDGLDTVRPFEHQNSSTTIDRIQADHMELNTFILLLPTAQQCELLTEAYKNGLQWPHNIWIVIGESASTAVCNSTRQIKAMENVLVITGSLKEGNLVDVEMLACTQNNKNNRLKFISDSIWALALAYNSTTPLPNIIDNATLQNVEDYLMHTTANVAAYPSKVDVTIAISQIKNGNKIKIGFFNTSTEELHINSSKLPNFCPQHKYETLTPFLTGILASMVALCIVITTAVLILLLWYRREPEVKATSVTLSGCMFLGFYLHQVSSLQHLIDSGMSITSPTHRSASCCLSTFSSTLGTDIVFAALLMKMLRVLRIFKIYGKTGRLWTDQVMLVLIALLVSVKVIILIAWASVDTYILIDVAKKDSNGHTVLVQQCFSEMAALWTILSYGYSSLLAVGLIAAAIKMRKIHHNDFKDTKKVCTLVFVLVYAMFLFGCLWGVLRVAGNSMGSKITIGVAFPIASMLCLGFLFVPKILPPLRRGVTGKSKIDQRLLLSETTTRTTLKK